MSRVGITSYLAPNCFFYFCAAIQKPCQQVDSTLDMTTTHKFPLLLCWRCGPAWRHVCVCTPCVRVCVCVCVTSRVCTHGTSHLASVSKKLRVRHHPGKMYIYHIIHNKYCTYTYKTFFGIFHCFGFCFLFSEIYFLKISFRTPKVCSFWAKHAFKDPLLSIV